MVETEPHHRRPRSLGGSDSPKNVSYVTPPLHESWHTLFGNMNIYQICNYLNSIHYKPENLYVVCEFINGDRILKMGGQNHSNDKSKISFAWNILFKGMNFTEAVSYMNSIWIDPSYHLYVRTTNT